MNIQQQPDHQKLPDQLESYHSFGSVVVAIPDGMRRVGCHGPCICWLNPGEETYGLHAEGAAMTRQDDANEILKRWEAVAESLRGVATSRVSRSAAMEAVASLERYIKTLGTPGDGFSALFAAARAVASVEADPSNAATGSDAVTTEAELRVIRHGRDDKTIRGPYVVFFIRGGRVGASVTGIQTAQRCQETAEEYSRLYGAPIVTPRCDSTPESVPAP